MKKTLILCAVVFLFCFSLRAENWPMFLKDSSHSAFIGETIESKLFIKWNKTLGSRVFGSPIIAENRVYVGTDKGELYCFDLFSGTLVWKYYITQGESGNTDVNKRIPTSIMCTPAYYDGAVYFTSYNGYLYCVNAMTGGRLWYKKVGGNIIASPVVYNGIVFSGSTSEKVLFAFNSKSGSLLYKLPTDAIVQSVPAVYDNKVYFGDNQGTIYCYDIITHAEVWKYSLPTGFIYVSGPSVDNEGVYFFPAYGQRMDVSGNNMFQLTTETDKVDVIRCVDPFDPIDLATSQKSTRRKTIDSMLDGMRFKYNPNPRNPSLLQGVNINIDQAKKNRSKIKATMKKALQRRLKQKYKSRKMKASSYKSLMRKTVANPEFFSKQYASNIVVKDKIAYMIVMKSMYTVWESPSTGKKYYSVTHLNHVLLAIDLELKVEKYSIVLGTSKEIHSDIAPWLPETDVVDFNRYSTSPVISGDKIVALTPSGKVKVFDRFSGLEENGLEGEDKVEYGVDKDVGYSVFYGSPAFSNGRLVVVDKFGKIGCYGVTKAEDPKIEILEPAEQKVVESELMVKWSIYNPDPAKLYYVHFFYDENTIGYDGKACSGLSYKRSSGVPIGSWSTTNVLRERFYYLYAVMTDAPFGSYDPIGEANEVYYSDYTKYPVLVTNDEKAPSLSLLNPAGEVYKDLEKQSSYIINWIDYDKDSDAEISLYYSPTGSMIDAKLIKSGISENDENDFFVFDVRTVLDDEKVKAAGGVVYFIGKIYDGEGSAKFAVSPGWLKVKMDVSSDLDSLSIAHTPLYGLQEIADYPLDAYVKGPKVIPDDGYVKLFYKVNDDASYSQIEMTSSDYFKYSGTLPQAAADSVVYYYIEANDGSETVTSPASNAISAPYSFKVKGLDVTGWTGKLNLSVSESVDPDYFEWGMDKNATDYKDDLRDVIEDELTETGISVYSTITSADEKETFKLGTDIWEEKDLGASVMKNNLTIKAKNLSGKEITLNWDIMGVPANYGVQLIEKDTETYIDLREQTEHTIKITSADFSVEYIITTGLAYFEKTYRKGWNLISFPVNAVDEDLVPEKIKIVMDRFLYGKKFSIYHYNDGEFLGYDAKFGGRLGYFKIGKGYWIKLPADTKLSVKGLDVRYEENEEKGIFSLDLKGGDWNMIGSPKLQSVPFSKIAVSYQGQSLNIEDAIDQELIKPYFFWYELYGFNLGFIAADDAELMPGYGYFLKSEVDCKLIIAVDSTYSPPPKKSEKSDYRRQKKAIFADVKKWQVKISAYCGDYKDKDNFIGINENATDGSDIRDVLEPMAITPGLSLYFPHPEYKSSEKGNYTVDIREPVASDGNIIWDMELVKYDLKTSDAELKWELSDFPSDYKLILKNMKTGAEYNMTSIKNAKIPLQNNEAVKFKVIYYKRTKPSY